MPASDDALVLRAQDGGVGFEVHAVPRASRTQVLGVRAGALRVSLAASPVEGEANEALVELLAQVLSVPKRRISLLRGEKSRRKIVHVEGVSVEEVRAAIER